jgi:hypothetical protein
MQVICLERCGEDCFVYPVRGWSLSPNPGSRDSIPTMRSQFRSSLGAMALGRGKSTVSARSHAVIP